MIKMTTITECPKCGNPKKPWFNLCFECNEKEKQKPTCEICGIDIPEDHSLCKEHWLEKQNKKKEIKQVGYVKDKKEIDFKEKFEGKFYFNGMPVKSKSELLLLYFFEANKLKVQYETPIYINDKEYRPDFIIYDDKGNTIILEHFGSEKSKEEWKIPLYSRFCKENKECFFIHTNEKDMFNLKDKLGKKINSTPLKKLYRNKK